MRINYYEFPEGVDPHVRYENGAIKLNGRCTAGRETCRGCDLCEEGWSECPYFRCTEAETLVMGCSVTAAKKAPQRIRWPRLDGALRARRLRL